MQFNRLVFPLFYLKHLGKRTAIVRADASTRLKVRVNTADILLVWEVWRFQVYRRKGVPDCIQPDATVLDIGSHIGVFSTWAARQAPDGRVIAYEAARANYRLLEENKHLNSLDNLSTHHLAVYDRAGTFDLYQPGGNGALGSILQQTCAFREMVTSVTLADVFDQHGLTRVDFLKIDVEGAEYPILFTTPRKILQCVRYLVLEYHEFVGVPSQRNQLVHFLRGSGFHVAVDKGIPGQNLLFGTGVIHAWRV